MLDFTSALYLGMRHPSAQLAPWSCLTLGQPAALREPPGAQAVAADLAALQGCEAACVLPSTLHLFWDLFGMLAAERLVILVDGGSYAIARWGAERAQALGLPLQVFPAGDVVALRRLAAAWGNGGPAARRGGRRPLILADGYVPGSDAAPPLASYAAIARHGGGYLLLDDTQVLGVSGPHGGGSARQHGLRDGHDGDGGHLLIGASLAKGFGVPLAVLAGSASLLRRFAAQSQTRVHASPPSAAVLAAARRALALNARHGDALRARLAANVAQWRAAMAAAGIACRGGSFPVQRLPGRAGLQDALREAGVLALAQAGGGSGALTFLLRADHAPAQLAQAMALLEHHTRRRYERGI
ncbi:aminotransferase class I/II-fold pyridoxal phosphate-dependent enzyme [Janthinobacterium sp. SUN118]|uniref:aminotransferase class I/II-fold pyridoxal phosphate-dependent enzyme n=1 Tax=Janthinobacterium sp. SUN118 TaxID=3004100 RepID=UPI0025B0FA44|nr:aminotransferase class I/II-fold pyridoxal phosphate-dependent enzyme [Janthinobacterium sp. SUN118]MDN2709770.1 aminotransferase class I/II-fold pyridoxal phosphate-dependent enzyme [Janthinobacterium sp. SUN118]